MLWHTPAFLQVILTLIAITGLVLMGMMVHKYFFYLSGIDVFFTRKQEEPFLVTTGLHGRIRHPLYTGTLLLLWSLCLFVPKLSHLLSVVTITLYTVIGARLEEAKLEKTFGDQYTSYKNRVPMLFPYWRAKPGKQVV